MLLTVLVDAEFSQKHASNLSLLCRSSKRVGFHYNHGCKDDFKLKPPLAEQELLAFDFADSVGFGLEDIFPHARSLAADGYGNYWVVDSTRESRFFGPIFYACHDAPVIVYQTDSLLHFIREVVRFGNQPWKSEIDEVHGTFSSRIWRENPCVLTFAQCLATGDSDLKAFAESLDESWEFADLRDPKLGDGYSWGWYGPKTLNRRYGDKKIFACQKKSFGRRLRDACPMV